MKKAIVCSLAAGFALFALCASGQAAIVLTVDISNPSLVKFTSTGAASSVTALNVPIQSGVTLLGILEGPVTKDTATAFDNQTLFANGSASPYASIMVSNYQAGSFGVGSDFNLFGIGSTQSFTEGIAAFTGGDEIYFYLSFLPFKSIGTIGDIVVGYSQSGSQGVVIGQYQVIPEPSSALLASLGSLLYMARLRWKRKVNVSRINASGAGQQF